MLAKRERVHAKPLNPICWALTFSQASLKSKEAAGSANLHFVCTTHATYI